MKKSTTVKLRIEACIQDPAFVRDLASIKLFRSH